MRIGLFTEVYKPYISGVATSVEMLKKALEIKGHEVYVVTINIENNKLEYDSKEHILRVPGIDVGIYENIKFTSIYPIKSTAIISKWKLDIIHTHTEGSMGMYGRILAKQFDIPVVHTYHTMYEDYAYLVTKGKFVKATNKLLEYASKFVCDTTITELIVPSKKAYNLFKEKYKFERNVYIIPNGVEIDRFFKENQNKKELLDLKRELGFTEKDIILMNLGRVSKEKNIDFLIESHRKVIKKCPNAKLLVVGDGPYMPNLKKLVSKYKLENNVIFTGMVKWEDAPKYYNIADLFTTASFTENHSMTIIEAMASSLPLVVAEDDGVSFSTVEGLNGYTFKDKSKYIKIITDLYENKSKLKRLGNQSKISSLQYSDKYYAEKILDVYNIALKDKKGNGIVIDLIKKISRRNK